VSSYIPCRRGEVNNWPRFRWRCWNNHRIVFPDISTNITLLSAFSTPEGHGSDTSQLCLNINRATAACTKCDTCKLMYSYFLGPAPSFTRENTNKCKLSRSASRWNFLRRFSSNTHNNSAFYKVTSNSFLRRSSLKPNTPAGFEPNIQHYRDFPPKKISKLVGYKYSIFYY
jgi:hypothetical protein